MKIRIKFDNVNIGAGSGNKTENHNCNNPLEGGFIEFDFSFLNRTNLAPPIESNRNQSTGIEENKKPDGIDRVNTEITLNKHGTLPVNGHDIYNYIAKYGSANFQIQAVVKLDGKLDPDKLLEAIKLSIDTEPVFGCRLIEDDPPCFKPLADIEKIIFCTMEEADNSDQAVQRFLESPLDMDHDPMLKFKLIRSGQYDTLCLKINHTCCDGTGAKEYLELLSHIYTCIVQNNGVYVPEPKIRTRKDQDKLFSILGIQNPETAWNGELDLPKTMWEFPWLQSKEKFARICVCRLPHGSLEKMVKYAKARGATINDLLVTGFYRAMFTMSKPQHGVPMDISMTVDLRRYLPNHKTEAIRNFSGGINTKLAMINGESFEGTLSRVIPMMKKIKSSQPGLQSAVGLERVEKAKFQDTLTYYMNEARNAVYSDKCSPVLSNLGFINKSLLKFGEAVAIDAYIVPPALCAPAILLCTGTYNGIITFAVSYYEAQVRREDMNRLLNLIKDELVKGCGLSQNGGYYEF